MPLFHANLKQHECVQQQQQQQPIFKHTVRIFPCQRLCILVCHPFLVLPHSPTPSPQHNSCQPRGASASRGLDISGHCLPLPLLHSTGVCHPSSERRSHAPCFFREEDHQMHMKLLHIPQGKCLPPRKHKGIYEEKNRSQSKPKDGPDIIIIIIIIIKESIQD